MRYHIEFWVCLLGKVRKRSYFQQWSSKCGYLFCSINHMKENRHIISKCEEQGKRGHLTLKMGMLDQVCAIRVFTSLTQDLNRSSLHFAYGKASQTSCGHFALFLSTLYCHLPQKFCWTIVNTATEGEHMHFLVQKKFLKNLGCTNFHGDKLIFIESCLWTKTNSFIIWMWFIHERKRNVYEYLYLLISRCQDMETRDVRIYDKHIITETRRWEEGIF